VVRAASGHVIGCGGIARRGALPWTTDSAVGGREAGDPPWWRVLCPEVKGRFAGAQAAATWGTSPGRWPIPGPHLGVPPPPPDPLPSMHPSAHLRLTAIGGHSLVLSPP